jgi:hypothetical protein
MGGAQEWEYDLEQVYGGGSSNELTKRLVGWRAPGDTAVLTYLLLQEIRDLKSVLRRPQTDDGTKRR